MSVISTVKDRVAYDAFKNFDFEAVVYDVEGHAFDAKIKKYKLNDKITVEKIEIQTPHVGALKLAVDRTLFNSGRFDVEGKKAPTLIERTLANWSASSVEVAIPESLKKTFESRWPEGSKPSIPSTIRFGLTPAEPKSQEILPRWPNLKEEK